VQATACAIVREAIANTSRYAGPTDLRVDLRRDGDAIVVTVAVDGPRGHWQPTRGAGHGLAGLRERVDALDGALHAGPSGAGFHLTARLPDGESR
jgi:two-component system sensor histidine kinase DesK